MKRTREQRHADIFRTMREAYNASRAEELAQSRREAVAREEAQRTRDHGLPPREVAPSRVLPSPACGKTLPCGGACIEAPAHAGPCLCAGDVDGKAGTCPA